MDCNIIRKSEEDFILQNNPKYNICKHPSLGGAPNLNRKLSDEWKRKISEKSKLYKHHKNKIIYNKIIDQNKRNASKYEIFYKNKLLFTGSRKECIDFLKSETKFINIKNGIILDFKINQLTKQKKQIKLFIDNEEIILDSYSACDKYLNMWRGYTSTQITKHKSFILNYKYELL